MALGTHHLLSSAPPTEQAAATTTASQVPTSLPSFLTPGSPLLPACRGSHDLPTTSPILPISPRSSDQPSVKWERGKEGREAAARVRKDGEGERAGAGPGARRVPRLLRRRCCHGAGHRADRRYAGRFVFVSILLLILISTFLSVSITPAFCFVYLVACSISCKLVKQQFWHVLVCQFDLLGL